MRGSSSWQSRECRLDLSRLAVRLTCDHSSFSFTEKAKSINLFATLRKLYRQLSRMGNRNSKSFEPEPRRCLEARHITVLCLSISRAWAERSERDRDMDVSFFSALQDALSYTKTDLSSQAFFNRTQCERLIECLRTGFEKAGRPVKVAVGSVLLILPTCSLLTQSLDIVDVPSRL